MSTDEQKSFYFQLYGACVNFSEYIRHLPDDVEERISRPSRRRRTAAFTQADVRRAMRAAPGASVEIKKGDTVIVVRADPQTDTAPTSEIIL